MSANRFTKKESQNALNTFVFFLIFGFTELLKCQYRKWMSSNRSVKTELPFKPVSTPGR